MNKSTITRIGVVGIVSLAAFIISFDHISDVAVQHGNSPLAAGLYPIAIDGMILASAMTLAARINVNAKAKFWATIARYVGFAFTIYANVLHAGWTDLDGMVVNGLPGVCLILTLETLIHAAKGTPQAKARNRK